MDEHIGRIPTPENWGADSLGKFLEDAHHNIIATFTNLLPQYNILAEIDKLYCKIIDNLNQSPEFVAGFFLIRTHSSFRGAVSLCLSGEVPEAYMVLRGCIESALYGLYVSDNLKRQEIWLRRHEDDESRGRVKNEFTIRKVLNHLKKIDEKTHKIVGSLYDRTIDYGAHPNERAISSQIRTESNGSRVNFTADYFLCGNIQQQFAIRSASQIGICCHDIFYNIFCNRYRILGIDKQLNQIRQGF